MCECCWLGVSQYLKLSSKFKFNRDRQLLPWMHCFFYVSMFFCLSVCLSVIFLGTSIKKHQCVVIAVQWHFCRILEITIYTCVLFSSPVLSFFFRSLIYSTNHHFIWSAFDMCVKCVLRTFDWTKLKIAPSTNLIYLIDCNDSLIHQTGIRHIFLSFFFFCPLSLTLANENRGQSCVQNNKDETK